jgi:hypothetical protein
MAMAQTAMAQQMAASVMQQQSMMQQQALQQMYGGQPRGVAAGGYTAVPVYGGAAQAFGPYGMPQGQQTQYGAPPQAYGAPYGAH